MSSRCAGGLFSKGIAKKLLKPLPQRLKWWSTTPKVYEKEINWWIKKNLARSGEKFMMFFQQEFLYDERNVRGSAVMMKWPIYVLPQIETFAKNIFPQSLHALVVKPSADSLVSGYKLCIIPPISNKIITNILGRPWNVQTTEIFLLDSRRFQHQPLSRLQHGWKAREHVWLTSKYAYVGEICQSGSWHLWHLVPRSAFNLSENIKIIGRTVCRT